MKAVWKDSSTLVHDFKMASEELPRTDGERQKYGQVPTYLAPGL